MSIVRYLGFRRSIIGILCLFFLPLASLEGADTPELNFLVRGRVVDESGEPIADAVVRTLGRVAEQKVYSTKSGSSGAFAMKVPSHGSHGPAFLVTDATGKLVSFVSPFSYTTDERRLIKVVLRPWKETQVTVVNDAGKPVSEATVVLQADYMELVRGTTNEDGATTLKFPSDARVDWINALKDNVGYDYYENYDAFPTQERLDVPKQIQLQLAGAVKVKVTVVDDLKRPVPNAVVSPWTIQLPGKLSYANVGGTLFTKTDDAGVANVHWFPNESELCSFLVHAEGFHVPKSPSYKKDGSLDLKAAALRNATVSGKVTFPDGSPMAGIRIQGEGRGDTNHYFRGHTTTKSDGTYEISIYPNQNTIFAITDKNYAAESAMDIDLAPGKKAKADFVLIQGTRVHGRMTVGPDKTPLAGETATLIQQNANTSLVRWSKSDPDGDYFFRVGPGTYTLRLPGAPQEDLLIKDEKEIQRDSHIARKPRMTLRGMVVDHKDTPVAEAEIRGESINGPGHAGFKTKSDTDGSFKSDRWTDKMVVFALSTKRRLAVIQKIEPDDSSVKLKLRPSGMVHGLIQTKDGQPASGIRVQLSFTKFGGSVHFFTKTGEDGKFAYPCPAGARCTGYVSQEERNSELGALDIEKSQRYEFDTFTLSK